MRREFAETLQDVLATRRDETKRSTQYFSLKLYMVSTNDRLSSILLRNELEMCLWPAFILIGVNTNTI